MFISDWKAIRCEEVQKNTGQHHLIALNSKTNLPLPQSQSQEDLLTPARWRWGKFLSRELRVPVFMGEISSCGWKSLAPSQISCYLALDL
jgi:hypothetical protein